jgi:hypothetical protein
MFLFLQARLMFGIQTRKIAMRAFFFFRLLRSYLQQKSILREGRGANQHSTRALPPLTRFFATRLEQRSSNRQVLLKCLRIPMVTFSSKKAVCCITSSDVPMVRMLLR